MKNKWMSGLSKNVYAFQLWASGCGSSLRWIVIRWIKLRSATLVYWDFLWLRVRIAQAKIQFTILTVEPEKTKDTKKKKLSAFCEKRDEDSVEENSSPSATALLNPYVGPNTGNTHNSL